MGTKTVLNEFVAYVDFAHLPPDALEPASRLIMTYALCGFANFGSLGIMIGGMAAMAPERRHDIVALGRARSSPARSRPDERRGRRHVDLSIIPKSCRLFGQNDAQKDSMTTYFTSDTHFDDARRIRIDASAPQDD